MALFLLLGPSYHSLFSILYSSPFYTFLVPLLPPLLHLFVPFYYGPNITTQPSHSPDPVAVRSECLLAVHCFPELQYSPVCCSQYCQIAVFHCLLFPVLPIASQLIAVWYFNFTVSIVAGSSRWLHCFVYM